MIEIVANEAELALGKNRLRMRTGRRHKLTTFYVSSNAEDMLQILYYSSESCSLLALEGFSEEIRTGRGEGVGSVGAVDMARGVGNGLGEVSARGGLRVIPIMMTFIPYNSLIDSPCRKHLGWCVMPRARLDAFQPS